jgi:hypothetical protein
LCLEFGRRGLRGVGTSGVGLTLVEAVAGIAILGAMLAAVLVATSRLRVQDARAARQIEACGIADAMLMEFWKKPEEFPRRGSGRVPGGSDWRWRASVAPSNDANEISGELVAVEFFQAPNGGLADSNEPALRVELILPAIRNNGNDPNSKESPTILEDPSSRPDVD